MSIILLIILLWYFPYIFMGFNNFKLIDIFFQNIRQYISDISVKSKYRYIRDYRYFHPCMYAQVCTRPNIAYIVGMLGRYLSNSGMDRWKKAKRVMRYLQRTKYYMLTYRRSSHLEIVGYSDSDFAGCLDSRRSTSSYIFMLAREAISWKVLNKHLLLLPP